MTEHPRCASCGLETRSALLGRRRVTLDVEPVHDGAYVLLRGGERILDESVPPEAGAATYRRHECQPAPECNPREPVIVYLARRSDGAVKIGSTGDLDARLAGLRRQWGRVTLVHTEPGGLARERELQSQFARDRLTPRGEWFAWSDRLACYLGERDPLALVRAAFPGAGEVDDRSPTPGDPP
jgi:hypothetical protein